MNIERRPRATGQMRRPVVTAWVRRGLWLLAASLLTIRAIDPTDDATPRSCVGR